jgi:hypothetical protein
MTWQPGLPIRTEQDRLEWDAWRRERILTGQRARRARLRRIDYADVAPEAAAIIDGLRSSSMGGDISSILNKLVVEWATFRNKVRLSRNHPAHPPPARSSA